ncbi:MULTISPECIES: M20 metallopeptidase family protein [Pseudoalteromonas]|jgi:hippurate hydrolase|uniref:Amidohydrolase n=1 Tax=Pseudoalteromonas lipolytica TaxID=570156 RepID=A0AAD0S112_9GAMM|nr:MULTISPECIES: amidohydrolase [Pseudoalteromonas]AXV66061.1 amidohydrolase [Pseudoalteromonas donghaensis]MCC9660195.1 amidohydrolase [Pseudoalteromonas sp. MB41]QLJ07581.1 amidohydrolase [Pseudoalteromonas sp. JSTW]QPL42200.1 amidohydrolase [Pseudoalteromonas sp. A41-2]SFT62803.1 hippurate hydrolase [Pseudoalteromonas lipolytica]|tara:strand:+ start:1206 stop:2516 length:1311 start_codon:yes stop_codon:yes gene_type:complete
MKLSRICAALVLLSPLAHAASLDLNLTQSMPNIEKLYLDLHQTPELSYHEKQTGQKLAKELKKLGFTVTDNVGGYGVVGLYKNGEGPTIMIRTDTDGLPIVEQTGKPYASKVTVKNDSGATVGVMHGCGHDIHMSSFIGTAEQLISHKDQWQGTLMMVAQPAEEVGGGAKAMLKEGLFSQYPTPDHVIALHVSASVPAGKVSMKNEYTMASVDSVDITVKGKGGHGAYPHTTIDPVVIASRIVLALQTITSRELSPLEPSVITVGSIHGGSKHNVISDEVKLQLTLRSYNPEVRLQQIAAIKRISKGIALSAGLDESLIPEVYVHEDESIPSTYNNPAQTNVVRNAISSALGEENVLDADAVMAGEDFGLYGRTEHHVPITLFWLGGVEPNQYNDAIKSGSTLPSLHSSKFAPDYKKALPTGITAMSNAAVALFNQ